MHIEFKNNKLEKSLTIDKEVVKSFGQLAKKIKQRMIALEEADDLSIISKLPAMRLHQYKGGRIGEWSIDIAKNWRIIFEFEHDPLPYNEDGSIILEMITCIKILSVEDPH